MSLSATHTLPQGSTSTPAVQLLLLFQLKQSVEAFGPERPSLHLLSVKSVPALPLPHTSSATLSLVKGESYLSTRWSHMSVT